MVFLDQCGVIFWPTNKKKSLWFSVQKNKLEKAAKDLIFLFGCQNVMQLAYLIFSFFNK